jgi:hypothetical protein
MGFEKGREGLDQVINMDPVGQKDNGLFEVLVEPRMSGKVASEVRRH